MCCLVYMAGKYYGTAETLSVPIKTLIAFGYVIFIWWQLSVSFCPL